MRPGVLAAAGAALLVAVALSTAFPRPPAPVPASPASRVPCTEARRDLLACTPRPLASDVPEPPPGYPARTADEVLRGLVTDAFYLSQLAYLRGEQAERYATSVARPHSGTPVLARALPRGAPDEWIVPLLDDHERVVTIVVVSLRPDGSGYAGIARGWSADSTFPRPSEADARAIAAATDDPAVAAELVYNAGPRFMYGDAVSPFWRVTRRSGTVVYVFEDGGRALAPDVGIEP